MVGVNLVNNKRKIQKGNKTDIYDLIKGSVESFNDSFVDIWQDNIFDKFDSFEAESHTDTSFYAPVSNEDKYAKLA